MPKIYLPNRKAIRYIGETVPYVFREETGKDRPELQKGDIVVASISAAAILVRKNLFEYVDLNEELQTNTSVASGIKDAGKGFIDTVKDLASKL